MSKFIVQMVNAYTREVLDTEDEILTTSRMQRPTPASAAELLQKAQRSSNWQGGHTLRQRMLISWLRRSMTRIDFPV